MHLFVCECVYIFWDCSRCGTFLTDSGEDSAFSSNLCVLHALELSDTSNAPLARDKGREKTSKREEPPMSILGLDSGEERDGGREERQGEGEKCGRERG